MMAVNNNNYPTLKPTIKESLFTKNIEQNYIHSILKNPYIPHTPERKQALFLMLPQQEAFYGGAGGGGKTDALLMGALQYIQLEGYKPLILRRTYEELDMEDGLMSRAKDWLLNPVLEEYGLEPKLREHKRRFEFPNGNRLNFGYLQYEKDKYRYQGGAFDYIAWDELTGFTETQYTFVSFSRQRKKEGSVIPLRIRGASNPGNVGHEWVYNRFIKEWYHKRPFIPASLQDNPHIDRESYTISLERLDPVTREQILRGNWTITPVGNFFQTEWFKKIDVIPTPHNFMKVVRYWDKASTPPSERNPDPDYTVGILMGKGYDKRYYILDMVRFRGTSYDNRVKIRNTVEKDKRRYTVGYEVWMEEEGGSSGKDTIDLYRRDVLPDVAFYGDRVTGSKESRAGPLASQVEAGNLFLLKADWNEDLIMECVLFPEGLHDDIVDSMSGAFNCLFKVGGNPYSVGSKKYDFAG